MEESIFLSLANSDETPQIDLHISSNVDEALDQLEKELYFLVKNKKRYAKIIYGIGKGVLKSEVLKVIEKHPLIKDYSIGQDGFCIVEL